jgi:16S rRNA (cytosine967-C5)-methyltransferase
LAFLLKIEGKSIRELEPVLNEQQKEWAVTIKAKKSEGVTPEARDADSSETTEVT